MQWVGDCNYKISSILSVVEAVGVSSRSSFSFSMLLEVCILASGLGSTFVSWTPFSIGTPFPPRTPETGAPPFDLSLITSMMTRKKSTAKMAKMRPERTPPTMAAALSTSGSGLVVCCTISTVSVSTKRSNKVKVSHQGYYTTKWWSCIVTENNNSPREPEVYAPLILKSQLVIANMQKGFFYTQDMKGSSWKGMKSLSVWEQTKLCKALNGITTVLSVEHSTHAWFIPRGYKVMYHKYPHVLHKTYLWHFTIITLYHTSF